MGLDVTAFGKLTKIENPELDEDGGIDGAGFRLYDNKDFPGRFNGLEAGAVYDCEESKEVYSSGYGRYNGWREELAKMAGYPATPYERYGQTENRHDAGAWDAGAGPFYELINFTDCDGAIGPVIAEKLAVDFAEFQARADGHENAWFREVYNKFRKGCELAANGGALKFH